MKTINDLDYVGMRDYDVVSKKDMKNLSEEVAKDFELYINKKILRESVIEDIKGWNKELIELLDAINGAPPECNQGPDSIDLINVNTLETKIDVFKEKFEITKEELK